MRPYPRLALVAALLATGLAYPSETYHPPTGGRWQKSVVYLTAAQPGSHAVGDCLLACNLAETEHRLELYARGLKPGATYTIWLWKEKTGASVKTRQVTSRWRLAKADARGDLHFTASLAQCPSTANALLVRYHAPGQPASFTGGVTVLRGRLPWNR